jgi:hypothetical protein
MYQLMVDTFRTVRPLKNQRIREILLKDLEL